YAVRVLAPVVNDDLVRVAANDSDIAGADVHAKQPAGRKNSPEAFTPRFALAGLSTSGSRERKKENYLGWCTTHRSPLENCYLNVRAPLQDCSRSWNQRSRTK